MVAWGEPPPGYDDCMFDFGRAPEPDEPFGPLDVPNVGVIQARPPTTSSVALLGGAGQPGIKVEVRVKRITGMIALHVAPGEMERLLLGMVTGDMPGKTMQYVYEEIACYGTAREYKAVQSLAGTTAASWRQVRAHLATDGIREPMRELPHVHVLLDLVESMLLEQCVKEEDRDRLMNALYRPEIKRGEGFKPPPGFDAEGMEAGFDALMAAQ